MIEINWNPTTRTLRQFAGLVLPLAAGVVATWSWLKLGWRWSAVGVIAMAALVAVAGVTRPAMIRPIYLGWMVASYPLGWVSSRIVVAVVYYFVVTPIGVARRLIGGDPLCRAIDRNAETYWVARDSERKLSDYFRQF